MTKQLNVDLIKNRLDEVGWSPANLAQKLDLSREIISQWLKNNKFPRPIHLLQLSRKLNLEYNQLVIASKESEPIVAFRKRGNTKTTEKHIEKAKSMGRLLESLVQYLPFDTLSNPPTLRNPSTDYHYIQNVVSEIRTHLRLKKDVLEFNHLINFFSDLHAVIIPVLWGEKQRHDNALHIFLPQSSTTWVFLNLDTKIHDFKFWMAHELGHTKAPSLFADEAEDFADRFAGALLFPRYLAEREYKFLQEMVNPGQKVKHILKIAENLTISPYTILDQIEQYAHFHNLPFVKVNIGGATTNFNKKFKLVSGLLLDSNIPEPLKYIEASKEVFKSPFFDCLKKHLKENHKSASIISDFLDVSLMDSQSIYEELLRM